MITAWLKIRDRKKQNDSVLKHLNFWLKTFDSPEYRIVIYNEDFNLSKDYYSKYEIVNRNDIIAAIPSLEEKIEKSCITPNWKRAGFSLVACYFYSQDDLIFNIDADDIMLFSDAKKTMKNLVSKFKEEKMSVCSLDINLSCHHEFSNTVKHHWSFGVTLADRIKMIEYIEKSLEANPIKRAWGLNIDEILSQYFIKNNTDKFIAFTFPEGYRHSGHFNGAQTIKYIGDTVESRVGFVVKKAPLHPKTLVL